MYDLTCDKCGRNHKPPRVWPLVCRCGTRIGGEYAAPISQPKRHPRSIRATTKIKPPDLPCEHRGEAIRKLDCGCEGNSTLYQCPLRGPCLIRSLKASTHRGPTCDDCSYRLEPATLTAIIAPHWNPSQRRRLVDTYSIWAMRIGHPHECYELAYGEPEIPGSVVIRGDAGNVLWQKERLLNLAISKLPPEVRYVAWIDHDLVFENSDWLAIACEHIRQGRHAVQLFSSVEYLGPNGYDVIRRARGSVAALHVSSEIGSTAPGGAWLASRAWLDSIGGLYDRNIVGGGDATFFEAVTGAKTAYVHRQTPRLRDDCLAWAERVRGASVGYVPGIAKHIWHGDRSNRQYISRDEILRRYDFDPQRHIYIDTAGVWRWSDSAPAGLAAEVAKYFADRRDDG